MSLIWLQKSSNEENLMEKADVYSAAILMWEILSGKEWEDKEVRKQLWNSGLCIVNDIATTSKRSVCSKGFRHPLLDQDWPTTLKEFLGEMWLVFSDKRPSISEVIEILESIKKILVHENITKTLKDEISREFWLHELFLP